MGAATSKRIAVFIANWELISAMSNLVKMLNDQGYEVDLFLSRNHLFVEPDSLRQRAGIRVHELIPLDSSAALNATSHTRNGSSRGLKSFLPSCSQFLSRALRRARSTVGEMRHAYWHLCGSDKGLLDAVLVPQALSLMEGKAYECLIGIEKSGLVWAGQVAEKLRVPFLYYSLELYNDDYVRLGLLNSFAFKSLLCAERRYHRKAAATIIQDPERARVLLESNSVSTTASTIAYLPVSLLGGPCTRRSSFLHETLGIPRERKIILYFGHIRERRYALDVARAAQESPEDWVFVMHGFCTPQTRDQIERIDAKKRVALSLDPVSSDRIQEVIASADIGLALYSPLTQNERLTAFSSEKMAFYMQCGVPFIAFDYPGYERLAKAERCGAVVRDTSELPHAVATILGSYEEFRQGAYRAFAKYYDFAANFSGVSRTIERLSKRFPEN